MIRGGLNEWFGDFLGEGGLPTQGERPFQAQRLIFDWQPESQRPAGPLAKPIRQRQLRRGRNNSPVLLRGGLQLIVYPLFVQVGPVIKGAVGGGDLWSASHACDLNLLPGEEVGGEDSLRGDRHPARRRLPGLAVETQGCDVDPGHRAPRLLLVVLIDALDWRLADGAPECEDRRLLAKDAAQVVR